jgi:hypothetical protein
VKLDLPQNQIDVWVIEMEGLRGSTWFVGHTGLFDDYDEERIWPQDHAGVLEARFGYGTG